MPPDVSEIEPYIAYRLRLIHSVDLLGKMVDKNCKEYQAGYENNYDKYVRFASRAAADDYVFLERPPVMACAADQMPFAGYPMVLALLTWRYWLISIEPY